jgi:DNA-binding Lrp family transcriptional regulator
MDERRELLDLLLRNARESTADLARQTGMEEDRVESLIEELESDGVVHGYRAIVDWNRVEGEHVRAEVELNVELDRETSYEDIARRIAGYRQVESLRLVSGDFDFAVGIAGDSMRDVSRFIADEVAPIPEVTQTVTHYVMESYKEGGIEFRSSDDDDRLAVSP